MATLDVLSADEIVSDHMKLWPTCHLCRGLRLLGVTPPHLRGARHNRTQTGRKRHIGNRETELSRDLLVSVIVICSRHTACMNEGESVNRSQMGIKRKTCDILN